MSSKRKPNWSTEELEVLAEAVASSIQIIRGKCSPSLTNQMKAKCWADITSRVNAANATEVTREISDVKKKWQDISSLTKKKEAMRVREQKGTGGGPCIEDDTKPWEKLIIGTFTRSAVEGISGGVDTALEKETASVPEAAAGSMYSVEVPDDYTIRISSPQGKKRRKNSNHDNAGDVRTEFVNFEKDKTRDLEEYRKQKLALQEKMASQQEEMLQLQRRSTVALEVLAMKLQPGHSITTQSPTLSPFSVSPVIHFSNYN